MKRLILLLTCSTFLSTAGCNIPETSVLEKAKQGDSNAQYSLYMEHQIMHDDIQAFHWLEQSAKNGNPDAQNSLAEHYKEGSLGLLKDEKASIYWLEKAASQGHLWAQKTLAEIIRDGEMGFKKNEKNACQKFLKIAQHPLSKKKEFEEDSEAKPRLWGENFPIYSASLEVGRCYFFPLGFEQNEREAFKWFTKAAEGDLADSDASYYLGLMALNGLGRKKSYGDAHYWFKKAANKSSGYFASKAKIELGKMFFTGKGCIEDYAEAYKWFNLAASQGDDEAINKRDVLSRLLTQDQIAEGQRLARTWKPDEI